MTDGDDWLTVESLDQDARGIAHSAQGKVVFIEGALPGEQVQVDVSRRKRQWEQGTMRSLRHESALRVRPGCPNFGLHAGACGGCKMQHLDAGAQVAVKQRVLEDSLVHIGKLRPETVLRPIEGPAWGYRGRARLSVRYVVRKGKVLVGFHERQSSFVADMERCAVLAPQVDRLLMPLRDLIAGLDQRDRVPQIEVAVGDQVTALVLRHLEPLSAVDQQRLREFAEAHRVQWWLQPKGPDTAHPLDPEHAELSYALPEFGLHMPFKPTDFTQVNQQINAVMIGQALRLLAPQPHERIIDWFCGLGNFTLPLATRAAAVLGIEGSAALVQRAQSNAARNGLCHRTSFMARNLFDLPPEDLSALGPADKWLIDPPREGAVALTKALVDLRVISPANWAPPKRIVYVSCNPSTLARDAAILVSQAGYRCVAAGIVNMFPHTAHVESMAVFELADDISG
jgi:23S rRNA (uracil1939-C5)-methyltransferase